MYPKLEDKNESFVPMDHPRGRRTPNQAKRRKEYQTYPLPRANEKANGEETSSGKVVAPKFLTNAAARASWSLMAELNFVARTP
eukprot:1393905-Amorphochlora_amoeboformis.AAC.2